MANEQNLTPWKPGQSGNPKGRPKGSGVTDRLKALLDQPVKDGAEMTVAEALAKAAMKAALKGDHRFFKEILDRTEGKVTDKLEVDGDMRVIHQEFVRARKPNADEDGSQS